MRPNELCTHPDNAAARAKATGRQWGSCGSEKKEEGIDIVSDVVKVEDENLATPGCLREDRVTKYSSRLACEENPAP